MRRRENDQEAAPPKMPNRALEFRADIRDMLQHIDIPDDIEDLGVGDVGQRAHPDLAFARHNIAALTPQA